MGISSEKGHYSSDEIGHLEALYKSLIQQYTKSSAVKVTYVNLLFFSFFLCFSACLYHCLKLEKRS